jgi:phage tail protein X
MGLASPKQAIGDMTMKKNETKKVRKNVAKGKAPRAADAANVAAKAPEATTGTEGAPIAVPAVQERDVAAKGGAAPETLDVQIGGRYMATIDGRLLKVLITKKNRNTPGFTGRVLPNGKTVTIPDIACIHGPIVPEATQADIDDAAAKRAASTAKTRAARSAPAKTSKAPAEPKAKKMSALDTAAQVLKEAGQPMNAKAICEAVLAKGWRTNGKTPASTIYAAIIREIATKGKDARFRKTDRGLFAINTTI